MAIEPQRRSKRSRKKLPEIVGAAGWIEVQETVLVLEKIPIEPIVSPSDHQQCPPEKRRFECDRCLKFIDSDQPSTLFKRVVANDWINESAVEFLCWTCVLRAERIEGDCTEYNPPSRDDDGEWKQLSPATYARIGRIRGSAFHKQLEGWHERAMQWM